ncbi:nickel pincer cofactor biosynthesis protein LarC [Halorubellus sp. JP-L1]|uniref:nickel pincer cofactor biosynthesis protein LarC n=1 Tax=Halorubellus sp. JP-L1 TaxID=2715753 RepID=UPI00140BB715|nr:nickel pincer cofactor biosynthesis protein LarC [Halorubellus sp. JP-L1]NHN41360.1 nickel pincer cofactor biosynthesis protein LarC [Halorubellus sp. JP-L1]
MRTLAFDGRTGASGDMLLGALVAAGADPGVLDALEADLPVTYDVREVDRNGITATKVDVVHDDAEGGDDGNDHDHPHGDDHSHGHSHGDDHSHGHSHGDDHSHGDAEGHGPSRSYREVVEFVEGLDVAAGVREDALAVFELLGEAEASVHGVDLAETHFHEVGADDAIADVVGVCALLADLDVERVVTTPVAVGGGSVEMAHGTYPVPAPAVVELTERADWRVRGGPIDAELLTPTGAALLAHFAEGVESLPSTTVDASGYGAGTKSFERHPNVLRATVGDAGEGLAREDVAVLETNLDDATPEVLGGLQESLKAAGAYDVTILPTTMKKARPGHLVKVVCAPTDAEAVARRLAEETGTLGVRAASTSHRWVAERAFEPVSIDVDGESYAVDVKVASDRDGVVYDASAEYEDAAAVSRETGLPTREVVRRAENAYHEDA